MVCGLPIVVTPKADAANVVEPEKTGFLVPMRSPKSIAEPNVLGYAYLSAPGVTRVRARRGGLAAEHLAPFHPRRVAQEYLQLFELRLSYR